MMNFNTAISDLYILIELSKALSVREVARRLSLAPSQVTKAIQKIETDLGTRLFDRTSRGVVLTAYGREVVENIGPFYLYFSQSAQESKKSSKQVKELGIGSVSFLSTHLVPPVIRTLQTQFTDIRCNLIELAPDQMTAAGLRGAFDVAIHINTLAWPNTWQMLRVGEVSWHLCVRKGHPIGLRTTLNELLKYPFVMPLYWTHEGMNKANDYFPLKKVKRQIAHRTSTAEAAINLVSVTDSMAYLPDLLIRKYKEIDRIQVVKSSEVESIVKPLYLSVRTDLVSQKLHAELVKGVQAILK